MKNIFNILLPVLIVMVIPVTTNRLFAKSTFSGSRIKQACINYVHKIVGNDTEVILKKNIDNEIFEETGIYAKCTGNKKALRGNCFIGLEFRKDGKLIRRLEIPLFVKIYGKIPVAIRQLKTGDIISNNDFINEKRDITYFTDKELISPLDLIGKKVKRNIKKGEIITFAFLERNVLVHKGDKVLIVAQSGAVWISSAGKALQDAAFGQTIRVKREGSRGILQGSVAKDGSIFIINK